MPLAPPPPAPPATPVETLTIKVNGRAVQAPRTSPDPMTGRPIPTTMLQACELAGVTVPHYCYHPRLPVAGTCRMCLVEYGTPALGPDRQPLRHPDGSLMIQKAPRPAISCATPIGPNMEIYTDTEAVRRMREGVLEFLLINHPLDCPICDQAGECKLQEYSLDHGQAASRFVETKVHKPKQVELGPRVMLDDERCILCSRCIRFTRDLIGDDALGFLNRGSHSTLAAYPGRAFDHNYTLNTVDICPVGALTSKDFRFEMRVWFLKQTKSLCTSCATGCNILIGSREGRVYRYVPRDNDAVNRSWMCDGGRLNYRWIGHPDRLTRCLVRSSAPGASAAPATWAEALDDAAKRLAQAPPGTVGLVASARLTNEELHLLARLAHRLGAVTDSVPRMGEADTFLVSADKNPNTKGAKLLGLAAEPMGRALPRLAEALRQGTLKILLVFGEDVTRHGLEPSLLGQLETLIVSDILPNPTTAAAHIVLPGCAHAEKRGTFTNRAGRVQRFFAAVEPPGEARPECEWLQELLQPLTGESPGASVPVLFDRLAREVPAFQGLTWAGLGDAGRPVAV